ncbi:MAG: hypothetical protein JXN64_01885 [Spirochaetes bacterium]|nr:hypothetical protein [Spirochaetota bacterium]
MIHKNDEFLHEFKNKKDWIESFRINFVCKKNKVFGAVDIDYLFRKKQIRASWFILFNKKKYENTNIFKFNGKLNLKKIGNGKFEYSILSPLEKFKLLLKNEQINANIDITGIFPAYYFPDNIIDNEISEQQVINHKTWNKYQQRCKINGNIIIRAGEDKGKKINFDCFGQREHEWGISQMDNVSIQSTINVQFRDMAMILTYAEKNTIPESNGYISKKSGNIPIINVECESLTTNKARDSMSASEFSYKDAQDDVDLLVAKSFFSIPMPLAKNMNKKFFRFRNFSEFTVIGTNKKGYGVEDHYVSAAMLKLFQSTD